MVYTEYFAKGTVPTETCDHHTTATICKASNMPAGLFCPPDQVETRVYIVGAESGSADSAYSISREALSGTCNVHTEATPAEPETPDTPSEDGPSENGGTEVKPTDPENGGGTTPGENTGGNTGGSSGGTTGGGSSETGEKLKSRTGTGTANENSY